MESLLYRRGISGYISYLKGNPYRAGNNGLFSDYDNGALALESGISVSYHEEGHSPETVVLLHGLNAHSGSWRRNVQFFSRSMKVIAPSMPPAFIIKDRLPVRQYVEILEELLSKLRVDSLHLIGNSMGGWVAMRYCILHPETVKALVLEDTAGVTLTKEDPIELGIEELGKISAPTLIVWGENDALIPVETAHILKARIRGSELVVLKETAHVPHWERSAEFNAVVGRFIHMSD